MVLPEQAEKKTACTVPAGDISLWKATPAEVTAISDSDMPLPLLSSTAY